MTNLKAKTLFKNKFAHEISDETAKKAEELISKETAYELFRVLRSDKKFADEVFWPAYGAASALYEAKEATFDLYGHNPAHIVEKKEEMKALYPHTVSSAVKTLKFLSQRFKTMTGLQLFRNEKESFYITDAATALAALRVIHAATSLEIHRQYHAM